MAICIFGYKTNIKMNAINTNSINHYTSTNSAASPQHNTIHQHIFFTYLLQPVNRDNRAKRAASHTAAPAALLGRPCSVKQLKPYSATSCSGGGGTVEASYNNASPLRPPNLHLNICLTINLVSGNCNARQKSAKATCQCASANFEKLTWKTT